MRISDWSSDVCSSDLGAYYRDPAWSPDGRRLVSLRMPRHDFLVQHADRAMSGANAGDRDDGQKSPDADADAAASAGPDLVWIDGSHGGEQNTVRGDGLSRSHFLPARQRSIFPGRRGHYLL